MSRALYLGVDGGGTTTRAVVVDAAGSECGRGAAGGSNRAAVGAAAAADNVREATTRAVSAAGGVASDVRAAWIGLAGVGRPVDHDVMNPLLASLAATVHLTSDAALGLTALPGALGVTLIAGTGTVAYGERGR